MLFVKEILFLAELAHQFRLTVLVDDLPELLFADGHQRLFQPLFAAVALPAHLLNRYLLRLKLIRNPGKNLIEEIADL